MPTVGKQEFREQERSIPESRDAAADLAGAERVASSMSTTAPTLEQSRRDEIQRTFEALRDVAAGLSTSSAVGADEAASVRTKVVDSVADGQRHELAAISALADTLGRMLVDAAQLIRAQEEAGAKASTTPDQGLQATVRAGEQAARLADLAQHAESALQGRYQEMRNLQALEQGSLVRSLTPDAAKDDVVRVAAAQTARQADDAVADIRLAKHVQQTIDSILGRLTSEDSSALRNQLGRPGADLDADAIQRVYDRGKAASAGSVLAAADAIKGQLAEELNDLSQAATVKALGDPASQYIAGHRITDEDGAGLSDGIVARRVSEGRYEITEAFEVKSGKPSARDLTYLLQRDNSPEVSRQARDLAVAALADEQRLNTLNRASAAEREQGAAEIAKRRRHAVGADAAALNLEDVALTRGREVEIETRTRQTRAALLQPDVQRTPGQLAATRERLDQQRIFVDGVELRLRNEDQRRTVPVRSVVPLNTRATADQHLAHTGEELKRASRAAAELMSRWNEKP
jgi:hypothetical protein